MHALYWAYKIYDAGTYRFSLSLSLSLSLVRSPNRILYEISEEEWANIISLEISKEENPGISHRDLF